MKVVSLGPKKDTAIEPPKGNPEVIAKFEEYLAKAKAGEIDFVILVCDGEEYVYEDWAGDVDCPYQVLGAMSVAIDSFKNEFMT